MNLAVCPSCSAALLAGARFCSSCGARLVERGVARSRFMTVLFCDLAGSTALTDALGDEAMFDVVTRYHEICNSVTADHGGFVAKYMGDGMLAYFGYPQALKNSALPAVKAALEIVGKTSRISLPGRGSLAASAGVATGWMVVGDVNTGSPAAEILAIGGTVNLAARLQAEAGSGNVAVSAETGRRLEAASIALAPLGARKMRGFSRDVEVWLAANDATEAPVNAFVGRVAQRAQLRELWQSVCENRIEAAVITAPGGYGKTALAEQFLLETMHEGDVLTLRCEPHRREQSFACFRPFIQTLAGLDAAATVEAKRDLLHEWAPEAAELGLSLLCDIGSVQPAPVVRNELIATALKSVLAASVTSAPAVLYVEDAHWMDAESARLIAELPLHMNGRPLLLLITQRPEGTGVTLDQAVTIPLNGISRDSAETLVQKLDSGDVLPAEIRRQVIDRAEGVPLFLEHITKAMLERPDADTAQSIPMTMIEALLERFDHLGDLRDLVDAAAVLGAEVRIDVLAAMLDRPSTEVSDQLGRMIRRGLFVPGGAGTVSFDHALIRDAVMKTLLSSRLKGLHEAALAAYRGTAPDRLEAEPVTAATHLMGADRPAEAIPFLIGAAQGAVTRGELPEALRLLDWSETGLEQISDRTSQRDELEMMVKFSRGLALVQQRGFSDASVAEAYERAMELCLANGNRSEAEFQIAWGIWAHYLVIGEQQWAESLTRRLDEIAQADPSLQILAVSARTPGLCNQGRLDALHTATEQVRRLYRPDLHRRQAMVYSQDSLELALLFNTHGRFVAGDLPGWQTAGREALSHEQFLDLPFLAPYVRIYSCAPNTYALSEVDYRPALQEATALAGELGQPFWVISGMIWMAHAQMRFDGPAAALEAFEAAIAQMDDIGLRLGQAYHVANLAMCRAAAGQAEAASAAMSIATDALDQGRELVYAAEVYRLRAEITLLADPDAIGAARKDLERARDIAQRTGARAWEALVAASTARLMARETGRPAAERWLQDELARIVPTGSEAHPAFLTAAQAFDRPI